MERESKEARFAFLTLLRLRDGGLRELSSQTLGMALLFFFLAHYDSETTVGELTFFLNSIFACVRGRFLPVGVLSASFLYFARMTAKLLRCRSHSHCSCFPSVSFFFLHFLIIYTHTQKQTKQNYTCFFFIPCTHTRQKTHDIFTLCLKQQQK